MNKNQLYESMAAIDDDILDRSENASKKSNKSWIKWGSLAACLCVVIAAAIALPKIMSNAPGENPHPIDPNLPTLQSHFENGSMGYEAFMFYDISDGVDSNPWTADAKLDKLPVYKNLAYTDVSGRPVYLSEDEMMALAQNAADALGLEINGTEFDRIKLNQQPPDTPLSGGEAMRLTANTAMCRIVVLGNGETSIRPDEPQALDEKYCFSKSDTTDKDAKEVLAYLLDRYCALYELDSPIISTWSDYTYYGEQYRRYCAFEGAGSLEERILSFNFSQVSFYPDENGRLDFIEYGSSLDCAEKIGDYPIISAQQAQSLLLDGEYITTVQDEFLFDGVLREEHIAKTELIYRSENTSEVFMPYYRFYVELAERAFDQADGLKTYGTYYVPAVRGEYLTDFPVWSGSFN